MTNGWSGPDPGMSNNGGVDLELSTRFTVHADITVTGIRVYYSTVETLAGRNAIFWEGGVNVLTVDIDDVTAGTGWKTYNLGVPRHYVAGQRFDLSHGTRNKFPEVTPTNAAFPRDSSDGAVTAAYGHYTTALGTLPNNASDSFYGIDIVFTNNTPAVNTNPIVLGMSVGVAGTTVTASVNISDETPASVTIVWDWGDGTTTSTGAGVTSAQHTYTANGTYAILATATDAQGAVGAGADAVTISNVDMLTADNETWLDTILYAVVSDARRSAYFDKVNTHEPKRKPGTQLTAAVWVQAIDPIPLASGLASTSARIVFMLRIYSHMLKEPQDAIDPEVMKATSNLMRRYHDDFDFDGVIRNVDLLGAYGIALSAQAGYLEVDGTNFRIMDILIPCIVNDVWPQVR